jgi:hypothetical protein
MEDVMKRLIIMLVAGTTACTTLFALQPIERTLYSQAQVDQIEKCIVKGLKSNETTQQVDAAMTLHRVREVVPAHDWDRCIIPLMDILNGEDHQPSARLLAAMVLHELHTERGDFAISRNALFTDDARVKRYCTILTRTRLVERTKL